MSDPEFWPRARYARTRESHRKIPTGTSRSVTTLAESPTTSRPRGLPLPHSRRPPQWLATDPHIRRRSLAPGDVRPPRLIRHAAVLSRVTGRPPVQIRSVLSHTRTIQLFITCCPDLNPHGFDSSKPASGGQGLPALDPGLGGGGRSSTAGRRWRPTSSAQASQQGAPCRVKVVRPVGRSTLTRQGAPCSPRVGRRGEPPPPKRVER